MFQLNPIHRNVTEKFTIFFLVLLNDGILFTSLFSMCVLGVRISLKWH